MVLIRSEKSSLGGGEILVLSLLQAYVTFAEKFRQKSCGLATAGRQIGVRVTALLVMTIVPGQQSSTPLRA